MRQPVIERAKEVPSSTSAIQMEKTSSLLNSASAQIVPRDESASLPEQARMAPNAEPGQPAGKATRKTPPCHESGRWMCAGPDWTEKSQIGTPRGW